MRKSILGALICGALFVGGSAHAGLVLDLNGALPGGQIEADALDWSPTSFLALGGVSAISNWVTTEGQCVTLSCNFDVLSHARLIGYSPTGGAGFIGLPEGNFGEITMVARYTETVTLVANGGFFASFESTGAGWLEFYWSPTIDGDDLTGFGFDNGTLIGRLDGVTVGARGNFTVDDREEPVALDGSSDGDQYPGQLTVTGFGTQQLLEAGLVGVDLDPTFFKTLISGFGINFENISIGLPFSSVNPSHCFTPTVNVAAVGTAGLVSACDNNHVNGLFSAQTVGAGYLPQIGDVNGIASRTSPDFLAQTDFNSSVIGAVPEPGTLALVGLALAGMGFGASRRRKV